MKSDAKQIIDKWVSDYLMQCELMEVDSQRVNIPRFLDLVVLYLGRNRFNPTDVDCQFSSAEEAEQFYIDEIKQRFGYIITTFPIEILYYYGYLYAGQGCFLVEELFGIPIESFPEMRSMEELYNGEFTSKIKDILLNKLGIKTLIK